MKTKYFECSCHDFHHTFRAIYDIEENYSAAYLTLHVTHYPLLRRIWEGIKIIFGRPGKFGFCEEVHLSPDQVVELIDFLDEFVEKLK